MKAALFHRPLSALLLALVPPASAPGAVGPAVCPSLSSAMEMEDRAPSPHSLRTTLEVTFLGNEGFLLVLDGRKILVDALFDRPQAGGPPPDLLEKMETAQPPFDHLDLILATHHHPDHFHAESVLRALGSNPDAVFLSTVQAVDQLLAAGADPGTMGDRIRTLDLPTGERGALTVRGIHVQVMSTGHSGMPEVENFLYLLSRNGLTLLHEGDSSILRDTFPAWGFDAAGVDVAFFHYGLLLSDEWRRFLQETVRPRHLIPMHISPSQEREARPRLEALALEIPDIHYLREPMEGFAITETYPSFN